MIDFGIRAHDTTDIAYHVGPRGRALNPLERTRAELKLAPGSLVRSAPEPRCVVDRVRA